MEDQKTSLILLLLTADGNLERTIQFTSDSHTSGRSIVELSDRGIAIGGDIEKENTLNSFIIQLDSDLNYCGDM